MKRIIQYEKVRTKQILNRVTVPSMPFEWSINPYRGCQHGCSFCYARSTHSFLGMDTDDTFQNHILLKANAPESLREHLQRLMRSRGGLKRAGRIAIGTATDPYQPVEAAQQLTRQCLEILAEYPIPLTITTRSPLILRDIDLLKRVNLASVNLSINTMNAGVWKAMEPSSPSPAKRMETLLRLREENIPAGIFMAPILPFLTDSEQDIDALLTAARKSKAQFVMPSYLRLATPAVKAWFFRALEHYDPALPSKYADLYRHSAHAPSSHKAPVLSMIRSKMKECGLAEWFEEADAFPAPAPQPEQLSFTF